MQTRIRVAIVVESLFTDATYEVLCGIFLGAKKLGMDVLVYACANADPQYPEHFQGELNIYRLPPLAELDAVLLLPHWTQDSVHAQQMCAMIQDACTVPVWMIGPQSTPFETVQPYADTQLRAVLHHMITVHGYTDIGCMTGPSGDAFAAQWMQAWTAEMSENQLPLQPNQCYFGDWAGDAAAQLAEQMLAGTVPMPRAMLFACDAMAIRFCDTIAAGGKMIPQEIAIGGFGGTTEALYHIPKVATYAPPLRASGYQTMIRLFERLTGGHATVSEPEMAVLYGATLESGTTCGCPELTMAFPLERFLRKQTEAQAALAFRTSNLMIGLEEAENLADFCERLSHKTNLLQGVSHTAICLTTDWDAMADGDGFRREGYTNQMLGLVPNQLPTLFSTNNQRSIFSKCDAKGSVDFFFPLHFNARIFGYTTMRFAQPMQYCHTIANWVECVCNGLEWIRVRNHLTHLSSRVLFSQLRDPFTGLYEKHAIPHFIMQYQVLARDRICRVMALIVDIDQLAMVNSQYGYEAGDRLILEVANRLTTIVSHGQTCFRLDGGQFLILGAGNDATTDEGLWTERVESLVKEFHQTSDVPYVLSVTTGFCCVPLGTTDAMERVVAEAIQACQHTKQQKQQRATLPHYTELLMLRRQIYNEPFKKWNIDEMCRTVFLSRTYFQTIYHRLFGVSCKQDVTDSKMLCAKRLLRTTNDSISAIAEQCAYDNVTSFLRRFKQCTGRSPDQFRKAK